jgi:fatty acid desaturase
MATERTGLIGASEPEMPVPDITSDTSRVRYRRPAAEPGWQGSAFPLVALVLMGYGFCLALGALGKLLDVLAGRRPPGLVVISLAIEVVVPFLPPLAYLAVWLSGRRQTSWFLSVIALCVLGLLTAVIEVYAHDIG